jgi:multicomponent Na+:H+ antiporter subunit C
VTPVLVVAVGLLVVVGVYLALARKIFSVILGLALLTHAANLILLAAGDARSRAPIAVVGIDRQLLADPVPQALVLTAIVISMAVTLYLLATFAAGVRELGAAEVVSAADSDRKVESNAVSAELSGRGRMDS